MPRKPTETVQVNLRMKESLRRKLEREASKHFVSLNKEMTMRIEDSFEKAARGTFESLAADMEVNWLRFSERFLLLDLQEQLAAALAKTRDPEAAKLANVWLETRRLQRKGEEQ